MVSAFPSWSHSSSVMPIPSKEQPQLFHPSASTSSAQDAKDKPKKPRHRHSAFQLAALNELYDKDEHPSLEDRTSLAERLGMEVKTVNAWFQNKRASSKKRTKSSGSSAAQCELPPISALIASVSTPDGSVEYDELSEDEQLSPFGSRLSSAQAPRQQSAFYAGNPNHRHLFEAESHSMPRKGRSRPSQAQTEELRKLYDLNPHPSKEEREELGARIGMRYQSVTNWFQNQRSIAKKRQEQLEEQAASAKELEYASSRSHTYSPFPPSTSAAHPSLNVPPPTAHPSLLGLVMPPRSQRSVSAAPAADSRASSPRPSPYSISASERSSSATGRPRRTRPEPYQLEALKKLFHRTPTPSIEERGALALEINMDVGKVTNWFRNLRQTARKRSKKTSLGDDEDDDVDSSYDFRQGSRAGSLGMHSASTRSPEPEDPDTPMDVEPGYPQHPAGRSLEAGRKPHQVYSHSLNSRSRSDMGSEEDLQEAVTPSPISSPYPALSSRDVQKPAHAPQPRRDLSFALDAFSYAEVDREPIKLETGVTIEDALLLLSFTNQQLSR